MLLCISIIFPDMDQRMKVEIIFVYVAHDDYKLTEQDY